MLKKFTYVFILGILLIAGLGHEAKASHAAGGELVYTWVGGNTYRFYFKFYRDCSGSGNPPTVQLCINNTCANTNDSRTMTPLTTLPTGGPNGGQVSTGCANQKNTCDSVGSTIPGYEEWWYSVDYTLTTTCTNWRFSVIVPVRNGSSNIVGLPNFYVETTLDNVNSTGNSSPVFSVKPVPYVCVNQQFSYNNGGIDPDGDSVAFETIFPLTKVGTCANNPTQCPIVSTTPALNTTDNPFQTNNTFVMNSVTGEFTFTPPLLGSHTVAVRVNEYRNGIKIGSVMRDIQVQVITCTGSSTTPTITNDPTSITGAATYSGGTIIGCATQQMGFCFDIKSTDTAAKLVATDNSALSMPGSTVTYTNLQNDSVRGCVTWTPNAVDSGNRLFVVTTKDSSCASGGVPINYVISVPVYVWAVTQAIKDTTICLGESVTLSAVGGSNYQWSVVPGGSSISSLSCTSCKNPVATPTTTTSYIVSSNSAAVCAQNTDTLTVTVKPLPTASATSNSPVCPGSTLNLFGVPLTGATYSWTGPNGFTSTLQNPSIPNAQTVNSGFYGLNVTNNGCTSTKFLMQVYVGPPAGPAAGSNSPVCVGNQLALTASTVTGTTVTYQWTGPNGFSSTQQTPIINNVTLAHAGKYYVYAIKDGCPTFTDSVTITVHSLPSKPTVTNSPANYCQNVVASPLTATGSNLKWYTVPVGGVGVTSLAPSTLSPGTFKYYVSQTVNGCEGPRDTATVNVTAKPADPITAQNVYYCQGDATTQLTATGTNLKWYAVPIGGSPLGSAPTPSSATAGNVTYYVSQTDGTSGCESNRIPVTVTVFATPTAPITNSPAYYCVGGPSTPALSTFVGGTNIKWYTVATGGSGSSTPPVVNTSVATRDTYYVSQTINGCEGVRGMMIVEVTSLPPAPQTHDTSYCVFETPVPVRATGSNLLWYTSATGGVGSATAPTPVTTSPGVFQFYVSQTIGNCESLRDSVTVTVHAIPAAPVGNDDSICEASTGTQLTATGSNLLWYTNPTGGIGSAMAPTPSTAVTGTFYWYVSQTVNGCESDRDTVEVEIVAKPAPPVADSAEFCFNGPADTLTANGQGLLWYYNSTGGIGSPIAIQPPTATKGIFYYYVSQTINGCESDRDTAVVTIDTLVNVKITASKLELCQYDSILITQKGLIPDTGTFNWNWNGGNVISGKGPGPYYIKWDNPGVKTIELNAENDGCKASDKTTVEVYEKPWARFDMIPEVCVSKDVAITADSLLSDTLAYNWTFDFGTKIKQDNSPKNFVVYWETTGQKIVKLRTMTGKGCQSDLFSDTITVNNGPQPKIDKIDAYKVCTETEMDVKANAPAGGLYKYHWTPAENFLTNDRSAVRASISSSGYIKVTATDEFGCYGSDSVYLEVQLCCKAILPTGFSPNNDGRNDRFGIISNGHYKIYNFRVVNRAGNVVFSTTNQNEYWDGTHNGKPADIGTYFYFIKYTCEDDDADIEIEETGDVTLIR